MELLRRLSAFVLNRSTDDMRSEIHEYLIMIALQDNEYNTGMTKAEIIASIEKELKIDKFPYLLIESALARLKDKRLIEIIHNRRGILYFLSQDQRNKINLLEKQQFQTIINVKRKLIEKIEQVKGFHVDMDLEIIFNIFLDFLATTLNSLGAQCCFAIIGSRGKDLDILKPINIPQILNDNISKIEDKEMRESIKRSFIEYLDDPDEDLSNYLYSLAQSYFIIHVLHLDPECESCTKSSLQCKKIYIDTNVIVYALVGEKKVAKAVDAALKLTNDLNINIMFSKRPAQEFGYLVSDAIRKLGKNPIVPDNRFDKFRNELKDGFLKDFLQKKKENPNLTFNRYADRLEEIESILKNRYSAIYDNNAYDEILKDSDLSQLKQIVVDEGVRFGLFKGDSVAEHDAFHIILIQELRKKEVGDILGPNYWFLTHDRSLFFVEKQFGKYEKFPSSIYIDNWVQLISPLLAPEQTKNARDVYSSLFGSRLPMLTRAIDEDVFLAYQGKWMDDEDLTPEDVARIIGNRYIKDRYEEIREEGKQITEEERNMIIQPLIEELKNHKKETTDLREEMKSLRQTAVNLQIETTELSRKLTNQRNIITRLGHLLGAIVFVIIWYYIYQYVLIQSLEPMLAFFGSMLIAAIFGALADFKGYKWLVERLLRYTPKA